MYVLGVVLGRKPDKAASEREGGGAVGRRERCPPALPAPFLPTSQPTSLPTSQPTWPACIVSSFLDDGWKAFPKLNDHLQNLSLETNIILVVR